MIGSGFGPTVVTHRVVITSDRSVMWSLCRWVSSRAVIPEACTPAAAARISTPRPQSTRKTDSPALTSVDGPARFGSTIGLPVPVRMMSICLSYPKRAPFRAAPARRSLM